MRASRSCLFLALLAAAAGGAAAGESGAVTTPGAGTLTMCRNWLVYDTCATYHNIALPSQVAIGDKLPLSFGSNPKNYDFPVRRIERGEDGCMIYDADAAAKGGDKIEVTPCRAVQPASGAR